MRETRDAVGLRDAKVDGDLHHIVLVLHRQSLIRYARGGLSVHDARAPCLFIVIAELGTNGVRTRRDGRELGAARKQLGGLSEVVRQGECILRATTDVDRVLESGSPRARTVVRGATRTQGGADRLFALGRERGLLSLGVAESAA